MGRFEVRTATDADWAGIADGFAAATDGDAGSVRRSVAHAFRDNPQGASGVLAEDPAGRIIGHLGVTHIPMLVKGEPLLFGRFHSCFIEPGYRTGGVHGLFAGLEDLFQGTFETREHLAAVFGQWDEVDWWYLRRTRGHDAIATSIDLRRPIDRPVAERSGAGVVITQGGEGSARPGPLDVGSCCVRRDGVFDAWRASVKGRCDRIWQAWRDGERTGMAITRDAGGVRWIFDWACGPEDAESIRALLDAIVVDARAPVQTRFWTSDVSTLLQFQEAGFDVAAGPEAYLSVRSVLPHINDRWLSESWHVTLADAGWRALPRLTVGESIVQPPSPGTLGRQRYE